MAKTRYLNAGADPGGDGTTPALSSGDNTHAFNSQSGAESSIQTEESDLSVTGVITLLCQGNTADNTAVIWDGFTNASASNYIEILGDSSGAVTGVTGAGYSITNTAIVTIELRIPFMRIGDPDGNKGIEIDNNGGSSDDGLVINGVANSVDMTDVYICGCLIWTDDGSLSRDGIQLDFDGQGANAGVVNIFNNAIWGWTSEGIDKFAGASGDVSIVNIHHNVMLNRIILRNVSGETTTFNMSNNIIDSGSIDIDISASGTTILTGSNNITGDTTFNEGGLTGGAQATGGLTSVSQASGNFIVVINATDSSSTNLILLDEEGGNLPVAFGADISSIVPLDAFGTTRASSPDNGFFEFDSGGETITGSGALASQSATTSGTGAVAAAPITGSGALQSQASATSGTAEIVKTGSGALASQSSTTAGTAEIVKTGSGSLVSQSASTAGTGAVGAVVTGSGALASQVATTAGTAEIVKTSTGALQSQSAVTSGTGDVVPAIIGSGALQSQSSSTAGTAEIVKTSTGSLQSQSATTSGTAEIVKTSTGALQSQDAVTAGSGDVTAGVIGEGELQAQDANTSGTGLIERTGTGALQSQNATTSGAGKLERKGSGVLTSQSSATQGQGFVGQVITQDCFTVLTSLIEPFNAFTGLIDDGDTVVVGLIKEFTARNSLIDDSDIVLSSLIDPDGLSINSNIQPTFNINSELCDCE